MAIDETKSYLYNKLWRLCAGLLVGLPKFGEKVYYFPQGHIEQLEASTNNELAQIQPLFNIPSKLPCNVIGIKLNVEKYTNELYAEVALLPDTVEVGIPIPNRNQENLQFYYFTKVLSVSDTSPHGGLSVLRKHALECLPPLDMSHPTPTQEIVAKDLHGREWRFKHIFRGAPRRHLFTTGWNAFVTANHLVAGDCFIFLRGENGETLIGARRVAHRDDNIPSLLISSHTIYHGGIAVGRTVDLTVLGGYNELIDELEKLFDLKDKLRIHNQWEIIFTDDEEDMMLVGDDPWPEFCNMVKKIMICPKEKVKIMKSWTRQFFQSTPRRHLFTIGWNAFVTANHLVAGDCFIFLRGENGETLIGARRVAHRDDNIPSLLISSHIIYHGVIASAMNAIDTKSMFTVFYKPRSSQFIVSFDKFLDAVNNKFNINSRFTMLFEDDDFNEK
ncbi:unnamed protein product, partial [Thlaspi arvense]